jgi:hypothetical protein
MSDPLSDFLSASLSPSEPTPEPISEPVFVALESDIEPTEPIVASVVLPVATQHKERLSVNRFGVDWVALSEFLSGWLIEYWRVPLALAIALILIVVSW